MSFPTALSGPAAAVSAAAAGTGPAAARTVSVDEFKTLMSGFPAGVTVVTVAAADGLLYGMTCTAVSSVSADPPTLLVCIQRSSRTLAALTGTRSFALNLLDEQAKHVAELFATRRPDCFEQVPWSAHPGSGGPHLDRDAHTIADCRVAGSVEIADHVVVFGEVYSVTAAASLPRRPLVYGMHEYWSLDRPGCARVTRVAARGPASHTDTERPR